MLLPGAKCNAAVKPPLCTGANQSNAANQLVPIHRPEAAGISSSSLDGFRGEVKLLPHTCGDDAMRCAYHADSPADANFSRSSIKRLVLILLVIAATSSLHFISYFSSLLLRFLSLLLGGINSDTRLNK